MAIHGKRLSSLLLFASWLALAPAIYGQGARLDDVRFPTESSQAGVRLRNAARLCAPNFQAGNVAALLTDACGTPFAPVRCLVSANALHFRQAQWDDALSEYQRLLADAADVLAPIETNDPRVRVSQRVRDICHAAIAALPPAILASYRQRVDGMAEKLLHEGQANRDRRPLQRLLREHFCSRSGDAALDLLGDLAFERGNFDEAFHWWQMLAVTPTQAGRESLGLRHPDPRMDVAQVRAKMILALIFKGDREQSALEISAFAKLHTDEGSLAGQFGKYSEILRSVANATSPRAAIATSKNWETFAGSYTRNRVTMPGPDPRCWVHGPAWRTVFAESGARPILPPRARKTFALHPVVSAGCVALSDGRKIATFDLRSGKPLQSYDLQTAGHLEAMPATDAFPNQTLSAVGNRLCACLGTPVFEVSPLKAKSFLVCLELSSDRAPRAEPGAMRELWHTVARGPEDTDAFFEGAPIMLDDQVCIAVSRQHGRRLHTALHCYDSRTGAPLWSQPVCEVLESDDQPRLERHLLTLAGPNLVYCSHSGAVVAVERGTGSPVWAMRYASQMGDAAAPAQADPRPCLYCNERIYVAPRDARRIFCLDAGSGRIVWQQENITVLQILGVSGGRLILTTPQGIRAFDCETGLHAWMQPDDGSRRGTDGRGLLAGGWVFWPTQYDPPLLALSASEGSQAIYRRGAPPDILEATQLRMLQAGNMACIQAGIVIAGENELLGYFQPMLPPH